MQNTTRINKLDIRNLINEFDENESLMLTISEPHIRLKKFAKEGTILEPIINEVIRLVNGYVFGKNKHYEFLKGIVVEENKYIYPHYHILLKKPIGLEFDILKRKLEQIAKRLCDESFTLDLSESDFSAEMKEILSNPCYDGYVEVSENHGFLKIYLTKQDAFFYILQERGFKRERDILEFKVNKSFDGHHFGDFANNYT